MSRAESRRGGELLEMAVALPSVPRLPGYAWRELRLGDASALHQLELECVPADGGTSLSTIEEYRRKLQAAGENLTTDTLCAADSSGRLAATAWVTCDDHSKQQYRVFLDGSVHPEYRGHGLGSFVLQWMEARALEMLSEQKEDRPGVLRLDFYDRSDDAIALFEKHGFRYAFAEDEMQRDLSQPVPAVSLPEGMDLVTWSPERAALFFDVYQDAFGDRPRFPHWSEETWRHNLTDYPDFRPDLSLLLLDGAEGAGFAICHVEREGDNQSGATGWIDQMGVRPSWRRRGLGTALLCELMRRFEADGLAWAALEVEMNNHPALCLYERLGFQRHRRRMSYQKVACGGGC
ncbi:MAG TPA: GNAT family N-acetyltransferase [Anaerolineae bacterium]|nr:GNAT family N-acetyltransferase [Anaerolineae bacterium]